MIVGTSTSWFRHLGLANRTSHRGLVDEDFGHFDNLLGDLDIMRCEGIDQQLFFHQRHRNIEHWCEDDSAPQCAAGPAPEA